MSVTRSPWITVLVILGIIALLSILYMWWRHAKNQKNLEAKQTEEMLKTPLEKFGDKEAEDLTKKYSEEDVKETRIQPIEETTTAIEEFKDPQLEDLKEKYSDEDQGQN